MFLLREENGLEIYVQNPRFNIARDITQLLKIRVQNQTSDGRAGKRGRPEKERGGGLEVGSLGGV